MALKFLDKNGLTYLWGKIQAKLNLKQNTLTFDTTPTANSNNPVTSGGVKTALESYESCLNSIGLANVGGVLYIAPRTSI